MIVAALLAPESARIAIPVALAVGYACYHWCRWRLKHPKVRQDEQPKPAEAKAEPLPEPPSGPAKPPLVPKEQVGDANRKHEPPTPAAGEEDFRRARAMVHQEIPDYRIDGLYLDLLGESAEKGYAPAMAKLGEYAMRRGTWVEAYYWMWRARRNGMANLDNVLRGIRLNWTLSGAPNESRNAYALFSEEAGSIGRALLNIDSGRDAYAAKEYLKTSHPEFL